MIDPNDYWVNNPLITPVNKALMYDNDIDKAKHDERERIIALLEAVDDEVGIFGVGWTMQEIAELIDGEN